MGGNKTKIEVYPAALAEAFPAPALGRNGAGEAEVQRKR